jgi:hypothetical protein
LEFNGKEKEKEQACDKARNLKGPRGSHIEATESTYIQQQQKKYTLFFIHAAKDLLRYIIIINYGNMYKELKLYARTV